MTVTKSRHKRKENELYETDFWATGALIRRFPVSGCNVWEPAAGNHKLADMLRVNGASVFTSDIATYQREHDATIDFLDKRTALPFSRQFDRIITNPPYGPGGHQAAKFCRRALDLCPHGMVAMLLTAKFDFGSSRVDLFRDNARFVAKIALIDRIRWFGGDDATDGTEDHAWYVWANADRSRQPVIYYEGNNRD